MKFQFYYEKLVGSDEYKNFVKENKKAYPCSGFFILDLEKDGENNQVHFDFWLPDEKKMVSFKMTGSIEFVNVENYDKRPFEKLSMNYEFDLEKVKLKIEKEIEKQKIKGKLQKILFSLQKFEGKDYLIITAFLNNLSMIKVQYLIEEDKIINLEKKSFMEMLKIVKKKDKN